MIRKRESKPTADNLAQAAQNQPAPRQDAPRAPALPITERMWQDALAASGGDEEKARVLYSLAFFDTVALLMNDALRSHGRLLEGPTSCMYSVQKNWEGVYESALHRRGNMMNRKRGMGMA